MTSVSDLSHIMKVAAAVAAVDEQQLKSFLTKQENAEFLKRVTKSINSAAEVIGKVKILSFDFANLNPTGFDRRKDYEMDAELYRSSAVQKADEVTRDRLS